MICETTINGYKICYVDEGPRDGRVVLLVHGNPTSSYLYRKIISPLSGNGYRCVAPDLLGFGNSDKPEEEQLYTFDLHVELLTKLVDQLELENITVVGQDWGGPISFRYAIDHKDNTAAIVALNTFVDAGMNVPFVFNLMFRSFISSFLIKYVDVFRKALFKMGFARPVDAEVLAEYFSFHPSPRSRSGIAAFPKMIPVEKGHPASRRIAEIGHTFRTWDVPALVAFSDKDMAFKLEEGRELANRFKRSKFVTIKDAGHYLQEDAGEEIARHIHEFLTEHCP